MGLTITIDDARLIATCLADELEERGLTIPAGQPPADRVLDAVDVAGMLGRSRDWVYEHAAELGGFRDGDRGRIGFDRERIEAWKRDRQIAKPDPAPAKPARRRGRQRRTTTTELIDFDS